MIFHSKVEGQIVCAYYNIIIKRLLANSYLNVKLKTESEKQIYS